MKKILELEALRGAASLYVFFHHTLFSFGIIEKNSFLGILFSFGQEAVMIFFLLSGFVIALSISRRHYSFKEYFKHRFLRIYTIVLIAWLISFISLISSNKIWTLNIQDFLINLIMLQDISFLKPGVFAEPLFGNSPLWSLSYEWWFYMFFFIHFYLFNKYFSTNYKVFNISALLFSLLGLVTYALHYNQVSLIVMYYYIWFSGAMVLLFLKENILSKQNIFMLFLSYVIIIISYYFLFMYDKELGRLGIHPVLELRHYSVAFMGLFVALIFYKYLNDFVKKQPLYLKIVNLFASIAPISFGLYVLHYPVKNYFSQFSELSGMLLLIATLLITLFLSYIAEIKIYGSIRKKYA